jgi:S1-C subfamily serine protease
MLLAIASIISISPGWSATDASARAAVVRVETAIDPISAGPGLAAELARRPSAGLAPRPPWTSYQAEVARRLRIGSMGTGFFVSSDGYLVTNAHVVLSGVRYRSLHFTQAEWDSMKRLLNGIRDVWVTVGEGPSTSPGAGEDERSYLAEPIAVDEYLDLAVLRVARPPGDSAQFAYLPLADSDQVKVGDPVRALGYAEEGFQDTSGEILSLITGQQVHERMNIVRGTDPVTGRETITVSGTSPGPVMRLHHNAPVGHGNSGGPILDAHGRVIGVAYALIAERTPGAEDEPALSGLNLAIASNVLKRFLANQSVPFVASDASAPEPALPMEPEP